MEKPGFSWADAERDAVAHQTELIVRIIDVVGLHGSLSDGELTSGVDAVSENDVLGIPWEHRIGTGPVVVTTTADCHPMETSWAMADHRGHNLAPQAALCQRSGHTGHFVLGSRLL